MGNSFVLRSWDGGGGGMSARPKTAFAPRAEFYDCIVSDPGLSRAAIVVAWRLVNHINDETGECFPSVERLSGHLDINERTVRRGVDQLVAAGWFTKKRRGRGGTHYYANYDENRAAGGQVCWPTDGPGSGFGLRHFANWRKVSAFSLTQWKRCTRCTL